MSCARTAESIDKPFGMLSGMSPRKHVVDRIQIPMCKGNSEGERDGALLSIGTFCHELCKNG